AWQEARQALRADRPRPRGQPDRGARPLLRLHRRAGLFLRRRAGGVTRGRLLVLALIVAAFAAFFLAGGDRYFTFEWLKQQQASIDAGYRAHPALTVIGYLAIYIVATGLSLPGAALLTLVGGALFGVLWGTVIVSFASSAGATLAFLAARFVLRDWVRGRFGARIQAIDDGVAKEGAFYLFTLRLVPLVPFFLINLAFGLTAM